MGPVSLLISVIIPVLIGCSSTSSGTHFPAEDEPSTIEVIGVQNELSLNSWKDDRVGLGIQAILPRHSLSPEIQAYGGKA